MAAAAALLAVTGIVPAAEGPSFTFEATPLSQYVWRGLALTNGPVLQTSGTVNYRGAHVNVFTNQDLSGVNGRRGKVGELDFMDAWYPIQVKQKDKVGRPDIDEFEAAMTRAGRQKGFFVAFDYTEDALEEVGRWFRSDHRVIVCLTVKEILEERIAQKLA